MEPLAGELKKLLRGQEGKAFYGRLLKYAHWKLYQRRYQAYPAEVRLVGGETSESILTNILCKIFSGERNLNLASWHVTAAEVAIKGMIKSEISHSWKAEREEMVVTTTIEDCDSAVKEYRLKTASLVENEVINEAEADHLIELCCKEIGDDKQLEGIFLLLWEGCKPQEVAAQLGLTIEEVRNCQKRMRVKLRSIFEGAKGLGR